MSSQHVAIFQKDAEHRKRVALLPVWIRFFSWAFLVFGILGLAGPPLRLMDSAGLLPGLAGTDLTSVSIYGASVDKYTPFPLYVLFFGFDVFHGVTAYALLFGRRVGVAFALTCSAIASSMLFASFLDFVVFNGPARLPGELVFILPFAYKMLRIRAEWNGST